MSSNEKGTCNRFEEQGLLSLERGEQLDDHYQQCADCRESIRAYRTLETLIAENCDTKPQAGWQDAVLREIHQQDTSAVRPSNRPWFAAIAAGVATIGIATIFLSDSSLTKAPNESLLASSLELSVIPANESYRGNDAKIGDSLSLKMRVEKPESMVLRLYRDNKEYFSCGLEQPCDFVSQTLEQDVLLNAYGEYQAVIYLDKTLVNVPSEDIDKDVLVAVDSKSDIVISDSVVVR